MTTPGSGADAASEDRLAQFTEHRRYLFAVAYRMLGVAEDAEDVLQEAWLRFAASRASDLESPRAYLVTIVSRLCLDVLRSARRKREEYVGPWLPEPVLTEEALPADLFELAESASFAFLLLLERLNEVERVVLVLHDVFDFAHPEIAEVIGKTPSASRQVLRRARLKLGTPTASVQSIEDTRIEELLVATRSGDVQRVMGLLAPDVALISDGGGRVRAISRPIAGGDTVARFLVAMAQMPEAEGARGRLVSLNGQPGAVYWDADGGLRTAFLFDVSTAGVTALYVIRNPEKLARLAAQFA